jgi:hypothetical protein
MAASFIRRRLSQQFAVYEAPRAMVVVMGDAAHDGALGHFRLDCRNRIEKHSTDLSLFCLHVIREVMEMKTRQRQVVAFAHFAATPLFFFGDHRPQPSAETQTTAALALFFGSVRFCVGVHAFF